MKFELFKDNKSEWRWHLKADNGEPIADSAEGYKNKLDCEHGIDLVKSTNASTPVAEVK